MPRRSTVLAGTVAGTLSGLLLGGAAWVGATAADDSAKSAAGAASRVVAAGEGEQRECGALWKQLPEDLRTDLSAARRLPAGEERRAAVKEVRRDALAGEYGEKVQRFAERRLGNRAELWSDLPQALKDDLVALRQLPREQRRDALADVREKALSGTYGEKVQQAATRLKERRETCRGAKD